MSIKDGEQGLLLFCFAGCSFADIKAELRRRGLIEEWGRRDVRNLPKPPRQPDDNQRVAFAADIWSATMPLRGTLGEKYLAGRGLNIGALSIDHCLRWHDHRRRHRLDERPADERADRHSSNLYRRDASKLERKMLRRAGGINSQTRT